MQCHFNKCLLTSSASKPPGITVPSFEQKQYGNVHSARSHFFAKSSGVSVIGAGARCVRIFNIYMQRNKEGKKKKVEMALVKKKKYKRKKHILEIKTVMEKSSKNKHTMFGEKCSV